MTLKELVLRYDWPIISLTLVEIYPEAEKNKHDYKLVFKKLENINFEKTDISIVITKERDDDEEYIDVSGRHKYPKTDEDKYPQGLEFSPWCKWLGMDIDKNSVTDFSEPEIIAHCLYEMTFISFHEEDIVEARHTLHKNDQINKSLSEKESLKNMHDVEEILKN